MVRHDVTAEEKRVPLAFFRTAAGGEPVREWLQDLPREQRKKLGEGLKELEYGGPIGMPLSRPMGKGLHELRVSLESKREARVLFVVQDEQLIALHALVKKSAKTPKADLDLARQRQRELEKKT